MFVGGGGFFFFVFISAHKGPHFYINLTKQQALFRPNRSVCSDPKTEPKDIQNLKCITIVLGFFVRRLLEKE